MFIYVSVVYYCISFVVLVACVSFSMNLYYALLYFYDFSFFFFKQKTAYEMRISDWSSDVCSSDLSRSRPEKAATSLRCMIGLPRSNAGPVVGRPRPVHIISWSDGVCGRTPHRRNWTGADYPCNSIDAAYSGFRVARKGSRRQGRPCGIRRIGARRNLTQDVAGYVHPIALAAAAAAARVRRRRPEAPQDAAVRRPGRSPFLIRLAE